MNIIMGGGYGEHGRNCFLVQGRGGSFLLDCGMMAGDASPYPRLSPVQVAGAEFLFLTHSHFDHSGALEWLYKNGFQGRVFLTRATYEQLNFKPEQPVFLEEGAIDAGSGLTFTWGKSGHCAGSVWYRLAFDGETLLFSGDYIEDTLIYRCDPIRGQSADTAILDCAYRTDLCSAEQNRAAVRRFLERAVQQSIPVLLPVPKYGRGVELMALIASIEESDPLYADALLRRQLEDLPAWRPWIRDDAVRTFSRIQTQPVEEWSKHPRGFVLVADPQLKKEENRMLCGELRKAQGQILLTGNQDAGSYSEKLIREGAAEFLRYSVHQNKTEMDALASKNRFGRIIPYHCRLD